MVFSAVFVIKKFTHYLEDVISTSLSLTIWLTDDFTKQEPIGNIEVILKERNIRAAKSLKGYYLFTDLADGNYTIGFNSDLYFPKEISVNTSLLDPKSPVVEIVLIPRPAYPFPENATLLRGSVLSTYSFAKGPLVSAEIEEAGKIREETMTDERGEFVLYFDGIENKDIVIRIKKYNDTKTVGATIKEGKTVSMGNIALP